MFPTIKTYTDIHDCLFSIIGGNMDDELSSRTNDEFTIKKEQGFIFIKYKSATRNTFPDPEKARDEHERLISKLRRECRGIIFEEETKAIVCRKFHKFFNINEREETNIEKINWKRGFRVLEKMDGSLVSPVLVKNRSSEEQHGIKFTTMLGFTEIAQFVDDYVFSEMKERQRRNYLSFCNYCIEKKWTPLFEFCSPKQTIVLEYTESTLTLLAIRKNESGEYMEFNEMVKLVKHNFSNDIPIVKVWKEYPQGLNGDAKGLLKEIYSQKQVEGYVIRFNDGDMYKVNTHWYNSLHGVETSGKSVRDRHIILGILDNTVDDLIACTFFAEDGKRNAAQFFRDEVERKLEKQFSVMKKELQNDCSPDSVTGQFLNFLKDQPLHSSSEVGTTEGREMFYTFLKDRFKLNSREFDKHRKLFYKWLNIDLSGIKPFFFTEHGILTDPKAEKSDTSKSNDRQTPKTSHSKKKK
ncbi:hypothetical protein FDP41_002853 [Naegleria fowleri]|uniref:T4 RNA ligase 1-like N-terminal domain-containing protein n=1 Tax=Naegleria fowleri TaxID=5763 RepID=A0A6A5BWZ6_NAEFO|nr:uncharacterized protein FDP41_002853 [Naegleria fowleri]KAF0978338.1 hypothetical protein FDP41_002853 [Naegleria fowleri]CAG4708632.1 unnamed protein product [Naegleria fowleri]